VEAITSTNGRGQH